ncbi:hypothetical protein GCM10009665_42830 [Kitasatospora nipponensis]|uniref:EcsC family protein n=1 Tax=Kitasatospora nipponensis TaxID=258049 RepID=A0ABN1WE27_9ACTN
MPPPDSADELSRLAAGMEHWDLAAPDGEAAREARGRDRLARLVTGLLARPGDRPGDALPDTAADAAPDTAPDTRAGTEPAGDVGAPLARHGRRAARAAVGGMRGLTDRLLTAAPRIPVRDLATLRAQHPKAANPEELADRLVLGATRASAAIGAGVGAVAVAPTPPALIAAPASETVAVAAVEIKLIAELHEVYGRRAPGTGAQRTSAYLAAWANRRGIDSGSLLEPTTGLLALSAGSRVRAQVRKRLTRSSLRKLPSLTPFLIGAALGARLNHRDTRRLAERVRADLRR